jgi:thymidylate synthase
MTFEQQYLDVLEKCFREGIDRPSRGGVDQRSLFGVQMRVDLKEGFPLLTTRKISFKIVAHEMLWILKAKTNIKYLNKNGIHIWDKFANSDGEVGPMYQWRNWHHAGRVIDQLKNVINEIKENPYSKRLIVSSWNVGELNQMALPPCPHMFQFMVANNKLHCNLTQRAGDLVLGVPYDLPVYALLTHIVAQVVGLNPGEIIYNIADCHIYHNHFDVVRKILSTESGEVPRLTLNKNIEKIDDFEFHHMNIENYKPTMTITAPVAVGPLFRTFFHEEKS